MRKFGAGIEMVDDNTTRDQVSIKGKPDNEMMKLIALDLPFESSMSVGTKVLAN